MKLAFNVKWLMEILRIYSEQQILKKYYVIKHLILQKGTKCDGYQRDPVSMVYKFFHEKSASLALSETFAKRATRDRYTFGDGIKNKNMSNQELAEELHKPII